MELLVLSACGLVANQYVRLRTKPDPQQCKRENHQQLQQQQQTHPEQPEQKQTRASSPPAPVVPLGAKAKALNDDARYNEQFSHPQDPNPNVSAKPWMRMINAPYRPKEEIESEIPGPQDVFGRHLESRVKKMEADFAKSTVPITSEKQFDRPVEQIATGNGSAIGFHIGAAKRYHTFIFNDQPTIESEGGPRGAFSGASGSHVPGDYRTVTQRSSLLHESVGPPVAVGVPQSSAPTPSFEITPAHLETYRLDDHLANGARAPVQASAKTDSSSFRNAHDENVNVLRTSLLTGAERFATGASGYRDAKLHVPRNNDPLETYENRVVPNFKVTKASDYQEQQITARQKMIPEMSQNVSALRKDRKPPVSGSTTNKNGSLVIDTSGVQAGVAKRGSSDLPVKVDTDAFCAPSDRKVVVAEGAGVVSKGASAARAVGSSSSSLNTSLFRTTQSVSEKVATPFIRGAGSKHASNLEPIHEATETQLSEVESSAIKRGMNKVATSVAAAQPTPPAAGSGSPAPSNDRGDIFKKSERDHLLVKPGAMGTNRVGAANLDAGGMISLRGLRDDDVNVVRVGPMNNMRKKKSSRDGRKSTKDPKLGTVLNARLGSSPAMKELLRNPYSLPAASRLSGV